jgi:hypothetical protein
MPAAGGKTLSLGRKIHMFTANRSSWARRASALGAAGLVGAGALVAAAGPASAGPAASITAKYKVKGSTFLVGPGATLPLGPGQLTAKVNGSTGKVSATLSLPPATASFKQFGVVPVTATTQFINDGPTTGKVNLKTGAVSTTSKITLQIVSLSVAGIPVPVGNSCETGSPVVVKLKSQKGFSIVNGGSVAGSYTIPDFSNCGLATLLINLTIPASGNTITLKLGKGKLS